MARMFSIQHRHYQMFYTFAASMAIRIRTERTLQDQPPLLCASAPLPARSRSVRSTAKAGGQRRRVVCCGVTVPVGC